MSGLEGLAAIAAATQLLEYTFRASLSVVKIRERILSAPEQFDRYACELNQLAITTRAVERNPNLQTSEILKCLSAATPDLTAAQQIIDSFSKPKAKRWYLKVAFGTAQRNIAGHLNSLHRTSTQLLVCIGSMTSTKLASVEAHVATLVQTAKQPPALAIKGPDSIQQPDIPAHLHYQYLMMEQSTHGRASEHNGKLPGSWMQKSCVN